MSKIFLSFLFASLLSFSANASLENYSGTYRGYLARSEGTLTLQVEGGVITAQLSVNGSKGVLANCNAQVGKTLSMEVVAGKIETAKVAFDPGSCKEIEGRVLHLEFDHDDGRPKEINVQVYEGIRHVDDSYCHPDGGCSYSTKLAPVWIHGEFKKQK